MCELKIVSTLDVEPFMLEKFTLPQLYPAPKVDELNGILARAPFVSGGCESFSSGADDLRFEASDQQRTLTGLQVQPVCLNGDLSVEQQRAVLDQFAVYPDGRLILQHLVWTLSEGALEDLLLLGFTTLVVRFLSRGQTHECWFDFSEGKCHICRFDYQRDPQPHAIYLFPSRMVK
jgi:hypothetical protein